MSDLKRWSRNRYGIEAILMTAGVVAVGVVAMHGGPYAGAIGIVGVGAAVAIADACRSGSISDRAEVTTLPACGV
jgi:hypothetical protein